jgi:hypothetical protein
LFLQVKKLAFDWPLASVFLRKLMQFLPDKLTRQFRVFSEAAFTRQAAVVEDANCSRPLAASDLEKDFATIFSLIEDDIFLTPAKAMKIRSSVHIL